MGLLAFAGEQAIGAAFALSVVGLYVAYATPIAARFLGQNNFQPGRFYLGRMVSTLTPLFSATLVNNLSERYNCRHRRHVHGFHGHRLSFPRHSLRDPSRHELYRRRPFWRPASFGRLVLPAKIRRSLLVRRTSPDLDSRGLGAQ